jgi:hypothetical protein
MARLEAQAEALETEPCEFDPAADHVNRSRIKPFVRAHFSLGQPVSRPA